MKHTWLWIVLILIIAIVIVFITFPSGNNECLTAPVTELGIQDHTDLALHIHPFLNITVLEEEQIIPANIGISDVMRPIHTHDDSGKLHVEGPCIREWHLGEFFDVWGETFTNECIFDNCVDETHTLTVYVNDIESPLYREVVLRDADQIEIVYEEK